MHFPFSLNVDDSSSAGERPSWAFETNTSLKYLSSLLRRPHCIALHKCHSGCTYAWQGLTAGRLKLACTLHRHHSITYMSQWSCAGNWIGNQLAALPPGCRQDLGPAEVDQRSGVALIGAVSWVTNYNVALRSCDVAAARGIARSLSERGGGIAGVQAMALPHGQGESWEDISLLSNSMSRGHTNAIKHVMLGGRGYQQSQSWHLKSWKVVELHFGCFTSTVVRPN